MDSALSYLDYEICLSRRSDLIPAVLDRVLQAQLPGCADAAWRASSHHVRNAEVATLRFLIEDADVVSQRNRLIAGGERLLDELFAASPWQSAPLVMAASKRPARPEIHVKCSPTDEEAWYARDGARVSFPSTLWRRTTERLRALRLRPHDIKNVLPVLVKRNCAKHSRNGWRQEAFSPTTDGDTRTALIEKARVLHRRGELAFTPEALNAGERRTLAELERHLDEAAELAGETNALATLRFLLAQMGFSDVETDYAIVLGLAGGNDLLERKEAT